MKVPKCETAMNGRHSWTRHKGLDVVGTDVREILVSVDACAYCNLVRVKRDNAQGTIMGYMTANEYEGWKT